MLLAFAIFLFFSQVVFLLAAGWLGYLPYATGTLLGVLLGQLVLLAVFRRSTRVPRADLTRRRRWLFRLPVWLATTQILVLIYLNWWRPGPNPNASDPDRGLWNDTLRQNQILRRAREKLE